MHPDGRWSETSSSHGSKVPILHILNFPPPVWIGSHRKHRLTIPSSSPLQSDFCRGTSSFDPVRPSSPGRLQPMNLFWYVVFHRVRHHILPHSLLFPSLLLQVGIPPFLLGSFPFQGDRTQLLIASLAPAPERSVLVHLWSVAPDFTQ